MCLQTSVSRWELWPRLAQVFSSFCDILRIWRFMVLFFVFIFYHIDSDRRTTITMVVLTVIWTALLARLILPILPTSVTTIPETPLRPSQRSTTTIQAHSSLALVARCNNSNLITIHIRITRERQVQQPPLRWLQQPQRQQPLQLLQQRLVLSPYRIILILHHRYCFFFFCFCFWTM